MTGPKIPQLSVHIRDARQKIFCDARKEPALRSYSHRLPVRFEKVKARRILKLLHGTAERGLADPKRQVGGLRAAEWTIPAVLTTVGYGTCFPGKWHLGKTDDAVPTAPGSDEMKALGLYHLNAHTHGDPLWFPAMDPDMRAMFNTVTKGALEGMPGQSAAETFKINGDYVDTPGVDGREGAVGMPLLDRYAERAAMDCLDTAAADAKAGRPFFLSVNFMKVHQPDAPDPDFIGKSMNKAKYADSVVEMDARVGHIVAKLKDLGLTDTTIAVFTTDNGAWRDVCPDAGYTPFRGTTGTDREGGNRAPMIAVWSDHIAPGAGRMGRMKFVFNLRGDGGQATGGQSADSNLGWKGPQQDKASAPQVFDLWQDRQKRHDVRMNAWGDNPRARCCDQSESRSAWEDLRRGPAAQAANLELFGSDPDFRHPEVPMYG